MSTIPVAAVAAAPARDIMPDLVRAVALMGIVVVNVVLFSSPIIEMFSAERLSTPLDRGAYAAMITLAMSKAYPLFSFMFGAGLAYQIDSAQRSGADAGARYFRRMVGLGVLGLLHVLLAFVGDILVIYAILGCALWLFKDARPSTLLKTALWVLGVVLALTLASGALLNLIGNLDPAASEEITTAVATTVEGEATVLSSGSFFEASALRLNLWLVVGLPNIFASGPLVIAFFLLGLWAKRTGVLADPSARVWRRGFFWMWPGLALSLYGALIMAEPGADFLRVFYGTSVVMVGAPLVVWGWLALIAAWARGPGGPVRRFVARAGAATLSAYLLQSLVLSLVFCGYGLGLYGQPGAAMTLGIAVATGAASIVAASLWVERFGRGPLERLLRAWTYKGAVRDATPVHLG